MDLNSLGTVANTVTSLGLLLAAIISGARRAWVWGWQFKLLQEENERLRLLLEATVRATEAQTALLTRAVDSANDSSRSLREREYARRIEEPR